LQKHNNSGKKSEPTSKRKKSRGPVQRDTKEVLAELVGKLKEKLDPKKVAATSAGEKHQSGELRPNLDRLTVGVDLGDQGSKSRNLSRIGPKRYSKGTQFRWTNTKQKISSPPTQVAV
jgi:hypothetical protein